MTIRRASEKRLAANGGRYPASSISKRSSIRKKKRSKSERERIYGPKGYVEWIHEQPCIACGAVGFSQCAHIKTGGTGRKSDWTDTAPLCGPRPPARPFKGPTEGCHAKLHRVGRQNFEVCYDIDLEDAAIAMRERWLEYSNRDSQ